MVHSKDYFGPPLWSTEEFFLNLFIVWISNNFHIPILSKSIWICEVLSINVSMFRMLSWGRSTGRCSGSGRSGGSRCCSADFFGNNLTDISVTIGTSASPFSINGICFSLKSRINRYLSCKPIRWLVDPCLKCSCIATGTVVTSIATTNGTPVITMASCIAHIMDSIGHWIMAIPFQIPANGYVISCWNNSTKLFIFTITKRIQNNFTIITITCTCSIIVPLVMLIIAY